MIIIFMEKIYFLDFKKKWNSIIMMIFTSSTIFNMSKFLEKIIVGVLLLDFLVELIILSIVFGLVNILILTKTVYITLYFLTDYTPIQNIFSFNFEHALVYGVAFPCTYEPIIF